MGEEEEEGRAVGVGVKVLYAALFKTKFPFNCHLRRNGGDIH